MCRTAGNLEQGQDLLGTPVCGCMVRACVCDCVCLCTCVINAVAHANFVLWRVLDLEDVVNH